MNRNRLSTLVFTFRNDYASVNVLNSAWVEVSSALPETVTSWEVFDSSGYCLKIGVGASGSEKGPDDTAIAGFYITPGGNAPQLVNTIIHKGQRIAIRAVDVATVALGQIIIHGYR